MDDEEEIAREAADFFGFAAEQGLEARRILDLPHDDFAVRFAEVARFAKIYGVDLVALAAFGVRVGDRAVQGHYRHLDRRVGAHPRGTRAAGGAW